MKYFLRTILVIFLSMFFSANVFSAEMEGMDHSMPDKTTNNAVENTEIKVAIHRIRQVGNKEIVTMSLKDANGTPLSIEKFKTVHTQRIHLFLIDASLTDYFHAHPVVTSEPGVYEFEWIKKKPRASYKLWVDVTPLATESQEFLTHLMFYASKNAAPDKTTKLQSTVDGLTFELSFGKDELKENVPTMGKIYVTKNGKPFETLQPVMGAYAHVVAFSDDFETIAHTHPIGKEPTNANDVGGPEIDFHFTPPRAGFFKIFAQVKVNGKEVYVPFGVNVTDSK